MGALTREGGTVEAFPCSCLLLLSRVQLTKEGLQSLEQKVTWSRAWLNFKRQECLSLKEMFAFFNLFGFWTFCSNPDYIPNAPSSTEGAFF